MLGYIFLFIILLNNLCFASNLKIVTSIRPLQSIVANITKDIIEPEVIIDSSDSLHHYQFKPSTLRKIMNSDVLILIDQEFETFLNKTLKQPPKKLTIVEVAKFSGLDLLPTIDDDHHHHLEEDHHHGFYDYHLWLDPENVKKIAIALTKFFCKIDHRNNKIYTNNLNNFITRLEQLDQNLAIITKIKPKGNYVVMHNAYQYFINRYKLLPPIALSFDLEQGINAKTFVGLKTQIHNKKIACIFEEAQFKSDLVAKLTTNTKIKTGVLDPEFGPNALLEDIYFELMKNLGASYASCLQ